MTSTANDPFALIQAAHTNGANYDLDTDSIIKKLKEWQSRCSFEIGEVTHDSVEIRFLTLPADMDAFAKELYDFCPDLVDQGTGCLAEFFDAAEETGEEIPAHIKEITEGIDFEDENYGLEVLKREIQRTKNVRLWWD